MLGARRDAEFTEFVHARLTSLRRVAYLLCRDWDRADDLVQGTITKLYVHWGRAQADGHAEAYARMILVREFLSERRSGWARRVSLASQFPDIAANVADHDAALDVRTALGRLAPRQRATLVLRFYCDLSVDQTAQVLGCTSGTVKSQTAKGLDALRQALASAGHEQITGPRHDGPSPGQATLACPSHDALAGAGHDKEVWNG
jgi:RNA polymerase sigma-70 factor (sigma-E family)